MTDARIVYGVGCSWWESIDKVGLTGPNPETGHRIPCCPHCGSVLYQMDDEREWWAAVERTGLERNDARYVEFMKWLRGKCYRRGIREARAAFDLEASPQRA